MSTTTAVVNLPASGVWTVDSVHSSVSFSLRHHAVARFRSGFTSITGSYDADESLLTGEVKVADLDLRVEQLKSHLLSTDFFNAEAFPSFSFASNSISTSGDGFILEGVLTLLGVTKPIVAQGSARGPQTIPHRDGHVSERLGVDLITTIDRRDWGLDFNNEVAEGIVNLGWDVTIEATLELTLN